MRKIILLATLIFGLVGCAEMQNLGNSISKVAGNIQSMFQPLTMHEFCSLKKSDIQTAKQRYENKGYIFTGAINVVQKNADHTVVGIKDLDDGSTVFSKVYNYTGQDKGQIIKLQGNISPANFDSKNRNQCRILLDNGQIK